ncbi:MAG: hypothetical protein IKN53_03895 [Oscillibacter sp.]|nr:hypothetical protein [Oscillibacter sp.]
MSMTTCRECGGEVSTLAETCPHCGAPQHQPPAQTEEPTGKKPISTKKILSIIALSLAGVSLLFGGLGMRIAALVIGIISYRSTDGDEKEAETYAKIAIIVSAVLIGLSLFALLVWGRIAVDIFHAAAPYFRSM